ncbi:hypothetical protein SS50377_21667 [Spironucleus salmonicida]|uniref:Uncharacterized protein n=1 Tax=Spironucleus salmonicida TaxID=348837 RepID=A0A9P8LXN4_9EUKA|nr:hypothetical protein SS50377_21667 [Spironucleus salmonicida]
MPAHNMLSSQLIGIQQATRSTSHQSTLYHQSSNFQQNLAQTSQITQQQAHALKKLLYSCNLLDKQLHISEKSTYNIFQNFLIAIPTGTLTGPSTTQMTSILLTTLLYASILFSACCFKYSG